MSYNNHKNETYLLQDGTQMSNDAIIQQQKVQEARNKLFVRDEFLIQLQKFTSQITRTIKQIEGLNLVCLKIISITYINIMICCNKLQCTFIETIQTMSVFNDFDDQYNFYSLRF